MEFREDLIDLLRVAGSVVVVTGSGVSAESGVPTFRGGDGLWRRYRAEDLATPQAFSSDPALVWEWYDWRRGIVAKAKPNPAHEVIADMERYYPDFLLVTQNVDGLHRKAGNERMVEIHGNIWRVRCVAELDERFLYDNPLEVIPPKCECGSLLRPAVVWFGESLPFEGLTTASEGIQNCEVFLTVGTSGVVYPVASFPMLAKSSGASVVDINKDATPITSIADHTLMGKAGEILPELWRAIKG
ncbi:MAG: NAD-dependent deacylase [Candidatus Proteinoplasmatales archaeon SG8-5]|nr:MAG: NAD-dependent deacylase [Candidatus Proteinoplasmatales archaeon SG8-5]